MEHRNTDTENNRRADRGRAALLKRIQALGFAKTEAGLYLDAHPDCAGAMEYYNKLKKECAALVEEYENVYGPLTADGVVADRWSWVDGVWPWQLDMREER